MKTYAYEPSLIPYKPNHT